MHDELTQVKVVFDLNLLYTPSHSAPHPSYSTSTTSSQLYNIYKNNNNNAICKVLFNKTQSAVRWKGLNKTKNYKVHQKKTDKILKWKHRKEQNLKKQKGRSV